MARPEGQIRIAYGAVPNTNTHRGGWCPVYWQNGRQHGDTYCRGFDRDEACQRARVDAKSEIAHYAGDWDIRLTERCATGSRRHDRGRRRR